MGDSQESVRRGFSGPYDASTGSTLAWWVFLKPCPKSSPDTTKF